MRDILDEAADEWGTHRLLHATAAGRALLRSHERAERAIAAARWGAILGAHASPDERAAWRRPPCAPPDDVPAWACAHAVRVLARVVAGREDAWRGGWDSVGHWGADTHAVAAAWHIARGRAGVFGAVLRWRVHHPGHGLPPTLRRLSAAQLRAALRVAAWRDAAGCDARALASLGELHPALRAIALRGADARVRAERPQTERAAPIRRRHLDWAAVSAAQQVVAAAPAAHRGRIAAAFAAQASETVGEWAHKRFGAHPPEAFPRVTRAEVADALWRGEAPARIAPGLTRAEAASWVRDGAHEEPAAWLCDTAGVARVRTIAVARWLVAVERDSARRAALHRERIVRGPHGEERAIVYASRVDEIEEGDLIEGPRTSVDRAFERAAERFGGAQLNMWSEDHRALCAIPAWWKPRARCARLLRRPCELVAEGRELDHCVGGYVPAVEGGQSIIIALNVRGKRSTLELSPDGRTVRQHYGAQNGAPPALCERAWRVIAKRIAGGDNGNG